MTTTTAKKLTVKLSDHAPVTIVQDDWPVIATAEDRPGSTRNGTPVPNYETDHYLIRVREHADGRRLVYGWVDAATSWTGTRDAHAGYLLPAGTDAAETVRAIRRIAGALSYAELADEAIADLPAQEI